MSSLVTSVKATGVQNVSIQFEEGDGHFHIILDGDRLSQPFWLQVCVDAELGRRSIASKQLLRNLRNNINRILGDDDNG